MDRARWQRIEAVVDAVLDLTPDARADRVRELCGGDLSLQEEVFAFLAESEAASSFLDRPAGELAAGLIEAATVDFDPQARLGRRLGAWELTGILGEGGMGVVYAARRADGQYEAEAAVKLLLGVAPRPGLKERLLAERQTLARLDDARIARLYDGGIDEEGHPYLVMEQVTGRTLTDHCDHHDLGLHARLDLFADVCGAVHAAHRQLVLHCDLKPSNILVTDSGELKLLDFGVARPLGPRAETLPEDSTARLLTPGYASPEQRAGEPLTPASDVYALGVLLHELLLGRRPESDRALDIETFDHAWRRQLRGDLAAIVRRALATDPADRYDSAEALATDLVRWREHRPVTAVPATAGYRLRRYLRRHRLASAAIAMILVSLLTGLSTTIWQARAAARQRDAAELQARRAEAVSGFLIGLFEQADPNVNQGADITAGELVARGREEIATLRTDPELRASLTGVLAGVHFRLGLYADSSELYAAQLADLQRTRPVDEDQVSSVRLDLATSSLENGDLDAATAQVDSCLAYRRANPRPSPRWLAVPLSVKARIAADRSDNETAVSLYDQTFALYESDPDAAADDIARALMNYGGVLSDLGRVAAADSVYALAEPLLQSVYPPHHSYFGQLASNWALVAHRRGDLERAETLYRRSLAHKRELRHNRVDIGVSLINLGKLLVETGRAREAVPYLHEAVTIQREAFGDDHLYVAAAEINLGQAELASGDHASAAGRFAAGERILRSVYGDDNPYVGVALTNRATAARAQGDLQQAHRLATEAVAIHERHLPNLRLKYAEALLELAEVELARGRVEVARERAAAAAEVYEAIDSETLEGARRAKEIARVP